MNSMKHLIIDGSRINDIPSFYDEINRVFMAAKNWKNSTRGKDKLIRYFDGDHCRSPEHNAQELKKYFIFIVLFFTFIVPFS